MWERLPDIAGLHDRWPLDRDVVYRAAPTLAGCGVAVWLGHSAWKKYKLDKKLAKKRSQLKASRDILIQQLHDYPLSLNARDSIVNLSLTELQNKLQSGELSAMDALRAFQSKAMQVDDVTNCVVEPILEAQEQAMRLDEITGSKRPLHGIPISIKENLDVKGYDTTAGLQIFINKPATDDSVIVKVLKLQGAIPFVRTNIPQTMYSYCCSNPIYGVTTHPQDCLRSPGGSSGGEGAILGSGGSIMGIGSDIGGSVRIPAAMCGVCALKPTRGRLSGIGHFSINPGQTFVQGTVGLMGQDVEGVATTMEALLIPEMLEMDPTVVPLPFRREMYESTRPLTIGYYTWDGCVRPVPAVVRAVNEAKMALEKMGHKVVCFSPPDTFTAYLTMYLSAMAGDRAQKVVELLADDYIDDAFMMVYKTSLLPRWMVVLLGKLITPFGPVLGTAIQNFSGFSSVYEWFQLGRRIENYKLEFLEQWKKHSLDAVICPVYASPAVLTKNAWRLTVLGSLTSLYNLLRYPVGVVPVTTVTKADILDLTTPDIYPATTLLEKVLKEDGKGGEGLPIGVQCVCLPYKEEQVLRVMRDLEKGLKL